VEYDVPPEVTAANERALSELMLRLPRADMLTVADALSRSFRSGKRRAQSDMARVSLAACS